MARIKEVKWITDKYPAELKRSINDLCKNNNVQNIVITQDEIGYYNAFIMIGSNEDTGKKKK